MRQTLRRLAASLAGGLVSAVLLVGCGGDDTDATPTFSPTTSPTAASTSASPVSPSTSATEVQETPEAFIKRWNQASTDMQNTGETGAYLSLVSGDCRACHKLARTIRSYYAAGGYAKATPWSISDFKLTGRSSGVTRVQFDFDASPTEYRTSAESPVKYTDGGPTTLAVLLRRAAGSWQVDEYLVEPT